MIIFVIILESAGIRYRLNQEELCYGKEIFGGVAYKNY